ncbi:MAG: hypothetical protein FJ125_13205 [Deltaproteobacteria bacterium]|nr:hypothetical protein [Deltaproteobacteria bacterium]
MLPPSLRIDSLTSATPGLASTQLTDDHEGWRRADCFGECYKPTHGGPTPASCAVCHGGNGAEALQRREAHTRSFDRCDDCHQGKHRKQAFVDPEGCLTCHKYAAGDHCPLVHEVDVVVVGAGGAARNKAFPPDPQPRSSTVPRTSPNSYSTARPSPAGGLPPPRRAAAPRARRSAPGRPRSAPLAAFRPGVPAAPSSPASRPRPRSAFRRPGRAGPWCTFLRRPSIYPIAEKTRYHSSATCRILQHRGSRPAARWPAGEQWSKREGAAGKHCLDRTSTLRRA